MGSIFLPCCSFSFCALALVLISRNVPYHLIHRRIFVSIVSMPPIKSSDRTACIPFYYSILQGPRLPMHWPWAQHQITTPYDLLPRQSQKPQGSWGCGLWLALNVATGLRAPMECTLNHEHCLCVGATDGTSDISIPAAVPAISSSAVATGSVEPAKIMDVKKASDSLVSHIVVSFLIYRQCDFGEQSSFLLVRDVMLGRWDHQTCDAQPVLMPEVQGKEALSWQNDVIQAGFKV